MENNNIEIFEFNGYTATVIRPEYPNGKWIWKTEFLYAYDKAEQELLKDGYTRVYYSISNKYGSYSAVRLMRAFFHHVKEKYSLERKCILFGFSRGGLYAFNFALFYPEYVDKVYLDAPVLDLKSWPCANEDNKQLSEQVFSEYSLNENTIKIFNGNPIDNLSEYFSLNIPTLLIAGGIDEIVPFEENSKKMIEFCALNKIPLTYVIKPECKHHPHTLDDVGVIIDFCKS